DLNDLSCHGRVDLACRLYRFDDRGLLALLDPMSDFRQLDIDHVAELRLRVVGDAYDGEVAIEPNPFMVLGEAKSAHRQFPPAASAAVIAGRDEGQAHDTGRTADAAHEQRERRTLHRMGAIDITHRDRPADRGTEAAARHPPDP